MNQTVLYTILSLSTIGIAAGVILYFVSQKFKVEEDPRIDDVEEALPAANCGGCGYPGCRNFAEACVKADDLSELYCPVGGNACMAAVAKILGKEAKEKAPMVAVVCCNGSCENRPKINTYDSAPTCAIAISPASAWQFNQTFTSKARALPTVTPSPAAWSNTTSSVRKCW